MTSWSNFLQPLPSSKLPPCYLTTAWLVQVSHAISSSISVLGFAIMVNLCDFSFYVELKQTIPSVLCVHWTLSISLSGIHKSRCSTKCNSLQWCVGAQRNHDAISSSDCPNVAPYQVTQSSKTSSWQQFAAPTVVKWRNDTQSDPTHNVHTMDASCQGSSWELWRL